MTPESSAQYQASPDAACCPLNGGLAIFDLRSNAYFALNPSGALLWERVSQPASLMDLNSTLAQGYALTEADVAADVQHIVAALVEAGLLLLVPSETAPTGLQ